MTVLKHVAPNIILMQIGTTPVTSMELHLVMTRQNLSFQAMIFLGYAYKYQLMPVEFNKYKKGNLIFWSVVSGVVPFRC